MADQSTKRKRRLLLPILAAAILIVGGIGALLIRNMIRSSAENGVNPPIVTSNDGEEEILTSMGVEGTGGSGLALTLSEGSAQPQDVQRLPVTEGEPLTDDQITAILARLPALELEPDDQLDFRLPDETLPPPRPGDTIDHPFPFTDEEIPPEVVEEGPLEVLRYSPEGEVPIAPFLSVTFNQPMVPLTALEDLAAMDVPVTIEPELPGAWRWAGTKTLTFQVDSDEIDRLPKATVYQVTVPAGTQSMNAGVLEESVSWTFSTPPPTLTRSYPNNGPHGLDPIIFAAFDQRIDPQAVLETIDVTADGKHIAVQLATQEEIEDDKRVSSMVEHALDARWLAFRAKQSLPKDAHIQINIGPGTPSAEGPRLTEVAQAFSFFTYGPMEVIDHGCSWGEDPCRPMTPLYIEFSNPIDENVFEESMLSISPALENASISIYGDTISIRGNTQGSTRYYVTLDKGIPDIFGQTLGKDVKLTFRIGQAEPYLTGPENTLVTLDPSAPKPLFTVYSINYTKLDVKIYAVQPSDWPAYKAWLEEYYYDEEERPDPPGRLVRDETMRIEAPSDTLVAIDIDLADEMDGQYGHFIVIVEPDLSLLDNLRNRYYQTVKTWVQVTDIGLDAFADHSEMLVWATDLQSGSPLSQVVITAGESGLTASTDSNGNATLALPNTSIDYLVARQGNDEALLPPSLYAWSDGGWQARPIIDELRWYVLDDRQMYRPGEDVHVKGWIRNITGSQTGDVELPGTAPQSVSYHVWGPQGNEIDTGEIETTALGGFDFSFTLPENINLGNAQIEFSAPMGYNRHYHSFQIQEFRRPEFEVSARNETTGPYFVGDHAIVAVEAAYYAGGPLPSAEVNWQVSSSATNYTPPNWPGFTFGRWTPWWHYSWDYEVEFNPSGSGTGGYHSYDGVTDPTGNHYLRLDFESLEDPQPYSLIAEATVFDVNRQAWAGSTSLMVHPSALYVGMRSERAFVQRGTPLDIELIATDLDGNPMEDRQIEVRAVRLEWKYVRGSWAEEEADVQTCTVGSKVEPVTCSFETLQGGRYQITATITDSMGRMNQSSLTRWVSGGQRPPAREVEQESVMLIPDKETYQPGDVAQILVQSPFSPAEGQLIVSRSGILYSERFQMEEDSLTLQVPIEEAHIPNLNIQVDLVGETPRMDDQGETLPEVAPRPAYASGSLNLNIPPLQRTLDLALTPREVELEPGGSTILDLVLKDANGQAVADAELAVVVVDEAILALTNYQLADPVAVFYQNRPSEFSSTYAREAIILSDPMALAEEVAANMPQATMMMAMEESEAVVEAPAAGMADEAMRSVGSGAGEAAPEPITVRQDFNPLATFAPEVTTDRGGKAAVKIDLPDNLTRYRIMVVAVEDGNQFGSAEANLVARLPLMVRPSAPRFLNFGDRVELPVVIQNQTEEPMQVDVIVQAANVELTQDQGQRVTVPANDRIEVRFPATTQDPGTGRLQFAAVSGSYADAAAVELPIYTPATTEAFATYGVIDEGAIAQPVQAPSDVFPQFGALEIDTSSTALHALSDAVLYLVSYRFECSEQLASRVLGIAALRDVLSAFSAEGLPSPEAMEAAVVRDIERLERMQNYDGGFPYWIRGRDSIPFNSIHVAHALQRAQDMGFEVPEEMRESLLYHLRDIESYFPHWYSLETRQTLSAYAVYVRDLMGDQPQEKALALFNEADLDQLPLEAVGWLWNVLIDDPNAGSALSAIRQHVNNRVVETAGAANFTTRYREQAYLLLRSDRRTDAILLDALIEDNPNSDLIPKVVNGLLAHREKGRWNNTQENVFVLLALDRYFKTFEAQTPDFVARIWLGKTYAGEHVYEGYNTERHQTAVPITYLVDEELGGGGTQDLILSKDGVGRLYYRLGLRYAPTDLELEPLDMGFAVQRIYEAVDDPDDVSRDEDGIWHVKAGARVRVRLTMVADNRRYHVALVDPLPAGLEIVNPALAVSGSVPQDPGDSNFRYGWWWWWTWYDHQNMRDERAEAFTPLLWEGVYEYTYITRATTPGTFVVPPTKAEEMYSPEVFGRSGSDWMIVEDAAE